MIGQIVALALLVPPLSSQNHRSAIRGGTIALCDRYPGADASVKIAACIADLPAAGGTADARGLQGAQNISVDLFATSFGRPITLLLGDARFTCPAYPVVNSACISLRSNTRLIGSGVTQTAIMLPNGWNDAFYRTVANANGAMDFEIASVEVNGNQGNYGGTERLTRQAHCIFVQQGFRFKVHDNTVHDCLGDAIEVWGTTTPSRYGKIYNNYVHDMIQAGIGLISVAQTAVYGNLVDPGVEPVFSGIHGEPNSVGQWSYKLEIHDNALIKGENISETSQIRNGLKTSHNSVRNNTLTGGGGILWMRNPYSEIAGNTIVGCSEDNAINIMSHDVRVLNNVITAQSPSHAVTNYSAAIAVDNSSANSGSGEAAGYGNNLIQGNTIQGWIRAGLRINNSSWNQIIANNIRNVQQGGSGMNAVGAYQQQTITGLTHDNKIIGNTIVDTRATPTMQWAIYCGSGSALYVALNDIGRMMTGPVYGAVNVMTVSTPTACSAGTVNAGGSVTCGRPFSDVEVETGNYSAVAGDADSLIIMDCTAGCTLMLPSTPPSVTWELFVLSIGDSTAAISPNGLTYNESASASALSRYKMARIWTDGSNYFGQAGLGPREAGRN